MTFVPYSNIKVGWSQTLRACDVQIAPTVAGRGRVAIDRTPASTFLIALGSDRRARDDDRIPGTLNGVAPGGLMARRGYVGDILRTDGQRTGSRLWLLEDAKQTEATRLAAIRYLSESVGAIAQAHGHDFTASAAWPARGVLLATAAALGTTVSAPLNATVGA
jgi:phage gp46-like protein